LAAKGSSKQTLINNNACCVDSNTALGDKHLMAFVLDIHAQTLELANHLLELLFDRIM
jgi:hypothetical protein